MSKEVEVLMARASLAIRAAGPLAYDEFMRALAARIDDVTERLVTAPPERTSEMQGRARELRDLFKAISEGPKLAQELREKEDRERHGPAPR